MGWLPFLCLIGGLFPRVGKCPANQRSGSRQGVCALRGPGAGHQAALAGPRNPGVLRQEEGVPALRLCQIVSTEPRRAALHSQAAYTSQKLPLGSLFSPKTFSLPVDPRFLSLPIPTCPSHVPSLCLFQ